MLWSPPWKNCGEAMLQECFDNCEWNNIRFKRKSFQTDLVRNCQSFVKTFNLTRKDPNLGIPAEEESVL